jgi:hypothetical protein
MFIVIPYMPQGIAGMAEKIWLRLTAAKKGA